MPKRVRESEDDEEEEEEEEEKEHKETVTRPTDPPPPLEEVQDAPADDTASADSESFQFMAQARRLKRLTARPVSSNRSSSKAAAAGAGAGAAAATPTTPPPQKTRRLTTPIPPAQLLQMAQAWDEDQEEDDDDDDDDSSSSGGERKSASQDRTPRAHPGTLDLSEDVNYVRRHRPAPSPSENPYESAFGGGPDDGPNPFGDLGDDSVSGSAAGGAESKRGLDPDTDLFVDPSSDPDGGEAYRASMAAELANGASGPNVVMNSLYNDGDEPGARRSTTVNMPLLGINSWHVQQSRFAQRRRQRRREEAQRARMQRRQQAQQLGITDAQQLLAIEEEEEADLENEDGEWPDDEREFTRRGIPLGHELRDFCFLCTYRENSRSTTRQPHLRIIENIRMDNINVVPLPLLAKMIQRFYIKDVRGKHCDKHWSMRKILEHLKYHSADTLMDNIQSVRVMRGAMHLLERGMRTVNADGEEGVDIRRLTAYLKIMEKQEKLHKNIDEILSKRREEMRRERELRAKALN